MAPGTALPLQWQVEQTKVAGGWSRLATILDRKLLPAQLAAVGWTLFFMASTISATAFGFSSPKMVDAAMVRITAAAALQKCNCMEIDEVRMRSFLGIPYVRISARPRHIQEGMVFSGR